MTAIKAIVAMETRVRKCIKKPPRSHAAELKGILPVIRDSRNSGPGIQAFNRSVAASETMKILVVVHNLGFLKTITMTKRFPTREERMKIPDTTDSTTASERLRAGSSMGIAC